MEYINIYEEDVLSEDGSFNKKALSSLKSDRHATVLQLIMCLLIPAAMIFWIFLFAIRLINHTGWLFGVLVTNGLWVQILVVIFFIIWIWGIVWMCQIDRVFIDYIKKINAVISAGKKREFEEYKQNKSDFDTFYMKYFHGKAVSPVKAPVIGKLFEKKKE